MFRAWERWVVTQLISEALESRGDLVVLWLDLANAYGSALHGYNVSSKIKDLILDYNNNFIIIIWVIYRSDTSDWQCLGKGIITGCTISVINFALTMNMVVKSAEVDCPCVWCMAARQRA